MILIYSVWLVKSKLGLDLERVWFDLYRSLFLTHTHTNASTYTSQQQQHTNKLIQNKNDDPTAKDQKLFPANISVVHIGHDRRGRHVAYALSIGQSTWPSYFLFTCMLSHHGTFRCSAFPFMQGQWEKKKVIYLMSLLMALLQFCKSGVQSTTADKAEIGPTLKWVRNGLKSFAQI